MRIKKYKIALSSQDIVDVKIIIERGEVIGFVLNLRCMIAGKWQSVYRVDTVHGYLHEQRFWVSPKPLKLPMIETLPKEYLFEYFKTNIERNYKRYRKYDIGNITKKNSDMIDCW